MCMVLLMNRVRFDVTDLTRVTKGDLWRDDKGGVGKVICKLHKIKIELEDGEILKLNYRQFRSRFKPYVLVTKPMQDEYIVIGYH